MNINAPQDVAGSTLPVDCSSTTAGSKSFAHDDAGTANGDLFAA